MTVSREAWNGVRTGDATLDVDGSLGTVTADRSRLRQLFENLFRNAVEHGVSDEPSVADAPEDAVEHGSTSPDSQARQDAVEHGVSDEPSVADAPEDAVEHGSTSPGSQASDESADGSTAGAVEVRVVKTDDGFAVCDDGPGIPEAERQQVFELDYTTAAAGTGLGLAIVREVTADHGWTVTVDESDAGGACFEVRT